MLTHPSRNLAFDEAIDPYNIIRVSATSDPQAVATAITNAFYDTMHVTLRAMGAASVNQAVKAIAIARGYVATRGVDLICRPGFTNVEDRNGDKPITAIVFRLSLTS